MEILIINFAVHNMDNLLLQLIYHAGCVLLGILVLILLFSPIIFAVLAIVMALCGKFHIIKSWFKKIGISWVYSSANKSSDYCVDGDEKHEISNSASASHMHSDSEWLSDIHISPSYSSFPCNSSYDTIGPGSWDQTYK